MTHPSQESVGVVNGGFPDARSGKAPHSVRALVILGVLAAIPRLFGLNAPSLWLDEVLQTLQVQGDFRQFWTALQNDAVHPPLGQVFDWCWVHLGASEPLRRLWPAFLGVVTVLLLWRFVSQRWGPTVGWLSGLLAAFWPFHVRYSQELRPYALALFFSLLALLAMEACLRRASMLRLAGLGLALLGAVGSLYFSATVVLPLAVLVVGEALSRDPERRSAGRRLLVRLPFVALGVVLAYAPWWSVVLHLGGRKIEAGPTVWSPLTLGRRWQFLTVGGVEGAPLTIGGILVAMLVICGIWVARSDVAGWAVVAGVFVGTLGIETALHVIGHWSNARYDFVAWPFFVILTALGIDFIAKGPPWVRASLLGVCTVLVVLAQLFGLKAYYERGRPRWQKIAQAVQALASPGEPVLVANQWTRVCLDYYLSRTTPGTAKTSKIRPQVVSDIDPLGQIADASREVVVVTGGYPPNRRLTAVLKTRGFSPVFVVGRDAVYVISNSSTKATGCSNDRFLPWDFRTKGMTKAEVRRAKQRKIFDFNPATTSIALLGGWSGFERRKDGVTFVWACSRQSTISLWSDERRDCRLRLDLWPFSADAIGPQRMRLELNDYPLGQFELRSGLQRVTARAPAMAWRNGENILTLSFSSVTAPSSVIDGARDSRTLAAAVDRLTVDAIKDAGAE